MLCKTVWCGDATTQASSIHVCVNIYIYIYIYIIYVYTISIYVYVNIYMYLYMHVLRSSVMDCALRQHSNFLNKLKSTQRLNKLQMQPNYYDLGVFSHKFCGYFVGGHCCALPIFAVHCIPSSAGMQRHCMSWHRMR